MFTLNYRHGDTSPLPFDWLVRTASKITRLWSQRRRVSYIFPPERTTTANSFDRCRRDASIAEEHFETADHLQQGIAPLPVGCPMARSVWCGGSFWRKTMRRSNVSERGSVISMMSGSLTLVSHPKILPRFAARRAHQLRRPSLTGSIHRQKTAASRGIKGMTDRHQLYTSHGSIVVEEAGRGELPVLLIHGNSLSREVFRKQLGGALSSKYRLVAFDLPGHGDSGDALNASRTYTRSGLADAATEVLDMLGLREVVVVGWSLGGHIALEMAARFFGIKGLLISKAPPVSQHNMAKVSPRRST